MSFFSFDTNLRLKNSSSEFILQNATNQHRFPRFVDFDGCIPKRTSTMSSEKLFGELFDENHRLTALEDWSNEALFGKFEFFGTTLDQRPQMTGF